MPRILKSPAAVALAIALGVLLEAFFPHLHAAVCGVPSAVLT